MTSSVLTKEQMTLVKPDEGLMVNRDEEGIRGFDREAIRYEIAPVETLEAGMKYVEEGQATFLDAETDMPVGPTGIGESMGNVELVRVQGGTQAIPRYTHGFSVDVEDEEVETSFVNEMRNGIMTLFDLKADYAFLQGLDRADGTEVFPGVFEWLDNNIPADNVIDCSTYDPSAGDLQGVPANVITEVAYGEVSGNYVTETWDLAIAKHPVWSKWNQYGTFDGAVVQSQWDLVDASQNEAAIGVNRRILLPEDIGIPTAPSQDETLTFPLEFPTRTNDGYTSPLADGSDDAMYLIPTHNGDFYELHEETEPSVRGPIEKEGWKERFEYKWRAGAVYGQNSHKRDTDIAMDAVKLENPTALFD